MEFSRGDVVRSLAGRDRGRLFFVVECGDEYVFLADGKVRRAEKPKRKKHKHVQKVLQADTPAAGTLRSGGRVLNSELRRDLAVLGQECQNQGG